MKVVITGAESFIGKELKRHCRIKNIEFVGIDTVHSGDTHHIRVDIRSSEIEKAIPENADSLIHLAAISRDQDCRDDPITAFDVNVGGTLNLIRAAQARRVKQFVFASSEWVYGDVQNDQVQVEDQSIDVTSVQSEYALTKLVGEQCLRLAHKQGFRAVTILRFGIVYGPRPANWSAVESVFNTIRTQDHIIVGSLKTARRFIHVRDVVGGVLAALGREGYEVFNLSGDRLITLEEIVDTSARLLDRRPTVTERDAAKVSVRNPDNRKARTVLKWSPILDLDAGLKSVHDFLSKESER